jgi:DNA-binding beta-propeller fold protein YncE
MKNFRIHRGVLALVLCGVGVVTPRAAAQNPNRITILKWYGANRTTSFKIGNNPSGVAFDGGSIWVSNSAANTVSKIKPRMEPFPESTLSEPARRGSLSMAPHSELIRSESNPQYVAFDSANIWVANTGSANVTKLSANTGVVIGTYPVGSNPQGLAFDALTSGFQTW